MRQKFDLLKQFKLICPVQSLSKKFFALPVGQIISTSPRRLVSQEGRLAIVTKRGAGCGGRGGAATNAQPADGKVVWSWSPDAGIKLAETTSAGDGGKKARSPRRSRRKPLKPLRGECRAKTGVTVVTTRVCSLYLACEAAGALGAPGIPGALTLSVERLCKTRALSAPRDCRCASEIRCLKIESETCASCGAARRIG